MLKLSVCKKCVCGPVVRFKFICKESIGSSSHPYDEYENIARDEKQTIPCNVFILINNHICYTFLLILILICGTQSCCTLRYLPINVIFERLRGKAAFPLVAMVFKSTAAPTVHTRHRCQLFPPVNSSQSNLCGEIIHYMSIKPTDTRMNGFSSMYCCCYRCC